MSDTVRALAKVPVVREAAAKPLMSRSVEFNLHSCYYRDFFLLRTPITINGRPARIKVVEGVSTLVYGSKRDGGSKSVELSTISLKAVGPVLAKHGIYHIDTYYHEQLSLYSVKFQSKSSLKRFLSDKEAVQKELSSAIAKVCAVEDKDQVSVEAKLYLMSPTGSSPEVHQVNLGNYHSIARTWEESKLFDFNTTMFAERAATDISGVCDSAELADLQKELIGVIAWFSLGVQLKIPKHDLLAIRKDHHYQTADCRLAMLLRWEQLETPTWSKLVSSLVNIGRKCLAEELAVKYGLPHPFQAMSPSAKESAPSEVTVNEQKLISEKKQLQRAKQSQNNTSRRLEKQVGDEVPMLEVKVKSLMKEAKFLRMQLKRRNEELEMFEELKLSVNDEQLQVLDRLVKEKSEQIKSLQDELSAKESELDRTKKMLREKEKEFARLLVELRTKSTQVTRLEEKVEKLSQSFTEQQEEMNRKLIKASAASVSQKEYLEELRIQRDCATEEASKEKEEIQHYNQQLVIKEKEITRLSENIVRQEQELLRLREELKSCRVSEQPSAEGVNEDDERTHQLLYSTTRLKLQLQFKEQQKNQQRVELQRALQSLEKHKRVLDQFHITLTKGPTAPTAMRRGSCAIIDNVAYFSPRGSKALYTINITTTKWGQLPTVCPCENSALVSINQELSSVGGYDIDTYASNMYEYTYATKVNTYTNKVFTYRDGSWVTFYPPMTTKRVWPAVLSTTTHVVAMGGWGGRHYLISTEVLDLATAQWATAAPLPYGTRLATTTVIQNNLYLMGGFSRHDDYSVVTCNIQELIKSANRPTTETQPSSSAALTHSEVWHNIPRLPVRDSTCATVQGQLVAIGGISELDEISNTIYRYNQDTNEWIKTGSLNTARSLCLAATLSDNNLLVVGGFTCVTQMNRKETNETETLTIT